ncbi:MAG: tungsten formylmethanofuran dehydrogenase, partial [Planctomycetota bacterium]
AGYANLDRMEINGSNYFESLEAFQKAVARARRGEGPTVVVSQVPRLLPHSSSDDHRKYRSPEELEKDRQRDPLLIFEKLCTEAGVLSSEDFRKMEEETLQKINEVTEWAEKQEDPDPSTATRYVFASWLEKGKEEPPKSVGEKTMMVDALNHALHEEMERNPKMVVYGQDIADPKGGVFTVTRGLSKKFGKERAFNAPLAESSIVGTAIGMAVHGFKPVVEIQFVDYIFTAMMQIRNELATLYYRSNGAYKCPVVVRTTCGGYIHGGLCHSQSNEAFFTHVAGLRVFFPSNAADAKGLLKAAIRGDDPVLFLEHKALYRQAFAASPEPDSDYVLPPGIAKILKEGEDLTVISWGLLVHRCLEAANKVEEELGASVEVLDLRTLCPLDKEAILESVKKTGKALIVHEDNITSGFGGEIAAIISSEAFEYLDGPVQRIAGKDAPIPYSPVLEPAVLPQPEDLYRGMKDLILY